MADPPGGVITPSVIFFRDNSVTCGFVGFSQILGLRGLDVISRYAFTAAGTLATDGSGAVTIRQGTGGARW
ncbi:hypothetical protein, partial [Amaricoccus tamworthensis]|uniref:hypothetical protein n=1 Tax=Amaricoccus tamworthensis TaxID=57002 RepID=UPI003C7E78FE